MNERLQARLQQASRYPWMPLGLLVFCVWLGWRLADTTLVLLTPISEVPSALPAAMNPVNPKHDAQRLARYHLFGDPAAQPAAPVVNNDPVDAPETRLRLTLEGVFFNEDTALSGAIISEERKPGEAYRVGDMLPGNAQLHSVHPDRVILKYKGRLETLRFEENDKNSGIQYQPATRKPRTIPSASSASLPRPAVTGNQMQQAIQGLGLMPVQEGTASGYLVGSNASGQLLARIGLRPGDVIVSINGHPVGDYQQDAALVEEVKNSGAARIEVQRDGQVFTVNYPL